MKSILHVFFLTTANRYTSLKIKKKRNIKKAIKYIFRILGNTPNNVKHMNIYAEKCVTIHTK